MADLIDRQAAIEAVVNTVSEIGLHDNSEVARYGATFRQHEILDIIEGIPSVQSEPIKLNIDHKLTKDEYEKLRKDWADAPIVLQPERKTGRWIYGEDDGGQDGWTCSECGFFVPWYYDYYGLNNIDFIRDFHTCPHCDAKMLTYTGKKMEVEHE